jgi:hypothetical protein
MFLAALFSLPKIGTDLKCPLTDEWMNYDSSKSEIFTSSQKEQTTDTKPCG